MKCKSIISTGTGNGIFLGKPLEENQKTAAGEGQGGEKPHGIQETVPHCVACKRETLHFWVFSEGIFDTLIFFLKS